MVAESNPLFSQQWHFDLIGDIQAVWQDYTGNGITVAIYDDGTEATHSDLDGNYNSSLHFSSGGVSDDGQPNGTGNGHGTAVAGLIAAENNSEGGVGIAFEASITGVDLLTGLATQSQSVINDALEYMENFDVSNNSWGYSPTYEDFLNLASSGSIADQEGAAFGHATVHGRDGLGTIILKAAGNEAANAQGEGHNSLHTILTIAATDRDGNAADYTNWGTNIHVTAPAASVTTDREGGNGYGPGDSADDFGGTSAATPVTAGIVALMLEANPDLGWRDVQNILAISAAHTGSAYGNSATGFEAGEWFSNGASSWNGGGMTFNMSYGFGMVDVFAAVRMAEIWGMMHPDAAVTSNEVVVTQDYSGGIVNINDNSTATMTFNVTEGVMIEHIYVTIEGEHTYLGDLSVALIAPSGEVFELFLREMGSTELDGAWTFGVTAALGDSSVGEWTISVTDSASLDTGRITDAQLEFRGSGITNNTVHHITADFDDYANEDPERRNIEDTDGGRDWINMASMSEDVSVDMTGGGDIEVGGDTWATISGGLFENLVTGDGNDTLLGNSGDNILNGARGNDTLSGRDGNDTLYGGEGADRLSGGSGDDSLHGDAGDDTLLGGSGEDTLRGGAGENDLFSGGGDDRVYGGGDADEISGASGEDLLVGGGGDDSVLGGNDADTLYGNSGDDTLNGEDGADWSSGGTGDDLLLGRSGDDTMRGSGDDDRLYGGTGGDLLAGNSGNDSLYGGSDDDRLFGGNDDDLLEGGTGSDTLSGGAGADTFVFGSVSDSPHGSGRDLITDFTHNVDRIDLSGFAGTLSFVSSYTGAGNEVRYNDSLGRLYIDIDGDGASDVSIDVAGAPTIDAGDLIL